MQDEQSPPAEGVSAGSLPAASLQAASLPAASAPAAHSDQRISATARSAISWLRDLTVSVVIAIVVILFLYQPVKVEGTSMTPGLINDERIFINKFVYRFGISDIVRGDTVVFWAPEDPTKSYIKRVIGIPGDVVEIRDGTVIL